MDDIERIKESGKGRVDVTFGSALASQRLCRFGITNKEHSSKITIFYS